MAVVVCLLQSRAARAEEKVHVHRDQGQRGMCQRMHHVSLRVSDVARAKRFYTETLGFLVLLDSPDIFLFAAGGTAFGI